MSKNPLPNNATPIDEIEALRRAIIQASEEGWASRGVSAEERERFRPIALAQANEATARLRVEYEERAEGTQQTLKFLGSYQDTVRYTAGDATTRSGGLWVCSAATTGAFDFKCWTLAVKRGDAR
ncbi:hypothetical protein BH18ACI5_BH18ACI5_17270 [soil metagenome]